MRTCEDLEDSSLKILDLSFTFEVLHMTGPQNVNFRISP
jgi:hypothetical protein